MEPTTAVPDPSIRGLRSLRALAAAILVVLLAQLSLQAIPLLLGAIAARRLIATVSPSPSAASPGTTAVTIERGSGGSMRTVLGYGFVLNKQSSLEREWMTIKDPAMPARIKGAAGVVTVYKSEGSEYRYTVAFDLETAEPLSAFEVRFLTFDVWGESTRPLSLTAIEDLPAGTKTVQGNWRVYSENEAEEYYASIGYVARVRTKSGRVITADPEPVVREAKKLSAKFTVADLTPQTPAPPGAAPKP